MKNILLIITGSIAAYKALELIRRLREQGCGVTPVLTKGAEQFITPMSAAALAEREAHTDLFSLKDEVEMGHIRLAREHDLILVAPASADMLAKMAQGRADDLASAILLAATVPVLVAPAMNHAMWAHKATRRNLAQLKEDGLQIIAPESGTLACGEEGQGRMAEVATLVEAVLGQPVKRPLSGRKALVTAGPTFEAIDPVRFLGNRSSGKQGYAIAAALAASGAEVTLVSGPVALPTPYGVHRVEVESAEQMLAACEQALPVEIAVCAAAVADWRAVPQEHKLKKRQKDDKLQLTLEQTPDILQTLGYHKQRPKLLVGFAAETENLLEYAAAKRVAKGCDWLLANDVSAGKVFGRDETALTLLTSAGAKDWGNIGKQEAAARLTDAIATHFARDNDNVTPMATRDTKRK